jgi:hypothetical protein
VCLSGEIPNILPFTSTMKFYLIPKKDALVLASEIRAKGIWATARRKLTYHFGFRYSNFEFIILYVYYYSPTERQLDHRM